MPNPEQNFFQTPRLMAPEELQLHVDWASLTPPDFGSDSALSRITDPAYIRSILIRQIEQGQFTLRIPQVPAVTTALPRAGTWTQTAPGSMGHLFSAFLSLPPISQGISLLGRKAETIWREQPEGVIVTGVVVGLAGGAWMFGTDGELQQSARSALFGRLAEGVTVPATSDLSVTLKLDVADFPRRYSAMILLSGSW